MFNEHPLVKQISSIPITHRNKVGLILAHIKAEASYKNKNKIDKFHSYLFRDYTTIIGYNKRYQKYNNDIDTVFPYGTAILGVVIIMIYHNDPKLAEIEASLICPHPQSLLACQAVIDLFTKKDLESITCLLNHDQRLSDCVIQSDTNVAFVSDWCRHYLKAVISGFKNQTFDHKHIPILKLIYLITQNHFHSSDLD